MAKKLSKKQARSLMAAKAQANQQAPMMLGGSMDAAMESMMGGYQGMMPPTPPAGPAKTKKKGR